MPKGKKNASASGASAGKPAAQPAPAAPPPATGPAAPAPADEDAVEGTISTFAAAKLAAGEGAPAGPAAAAARAAPEPAELTEAQRQDMLNVKRSFQDLLRMTDQSALRRGPGGGGAAGMPGIPPGMLPPGLSLPPGVTMAQLQALEEQMRKAAASKEGGEHKFWSTQPVPKSKSDMSGPNPEAPAEGAIEPDKLPSEVRAEPYPLPKEFEWCDVDINKEGELKELYTLLTENYVEDDDAMFRFDYSAGFLAWALKPPGWLPQWHVGVRVAASKKLVAFISAIPAVVRVRQASKKMVEINFLCSHKKLRSKRLAPVLIREITRRVHQQGIFQAVYTGGIRLPTPVTACRYYHRSLNPKKLIECGFSQLGRNMTMQRTVKLYKLPDDVGIKGWRPLAKADVGTVSRLLSGYVSKFDVAQVWTEEEVEHWFLSREGVVASYVVEDPATHKITDFVSFYSLPSSVIGNQKHRTIKAAYAFYYVPRGWDRPSGDGDTERQDRLKALMRAALVQAKNMEFDVFNCLNLMENSSFIEELKFGRGDGELNYYLYNWRTFEIKQEGMGLVML